MVGRPEDGQEDARQEAPEEPGKENVVGQLLLFAEGFGDVRRFYVLGDGSQVAKRAAGVGGGEVGAQRGSLGACKVRAREVGGRESLGGITVTDELELFEGVSPITVGGGVRPPQPSEHVAEIEVEAEEGAAHESDTIGVHRGVIGGWPR